MLIDVHLYTCLAPILSNIQYVELSRIARHTWIRLGNERNCFFCMHSPSPVEYSILTYIWFLFILYRNMEISLLRRGSIFEQAHTFYMSSKSDSQLPLTLCPQLVKKVPTQAQGGGGVGVEPIKTTEKRCGPLLK